MQIVLPQTLLLRGRTRDYMTRSEKRPGYRIQPPRRPKKSKGSTAYTIATLILLMVLYPVGLIMLWVRKLKWHTLVKLLVSVLTGAIFFFLLSIAITIDIDTDNPILSEVQNGIQKGYEAVGQAVEVVVDWSQDTWDKAVTEADANIRYIAENGSSALNHTMHTAGSALRLAYNWCADLVHMPQIESLPTATPAPVTPNPTETSVPLFATATPAVSATAAVTPSPSPAPTQAPTPAPTAAPTLQPIGRVTVYNLENGTYYHMNATCNSTTGGIPGTLESAINAGLNPCPRCGVPAANVLNLTDDIVYLDGEQLYHTSINCDAFTGNWKYDTLKNVFYSGYAACTECGADHYVFEPEEPVSDALNAARFITVYYHSNSTYYHANSSCGQMTGAAAHTLAEAVVLDGKERCPNCRPAEIAEEPAATATVE